MISILTNVYTITETITPERARELLARNRKNRTVRPTWVRFLTREIQEGRWQLTHQGVALDSNGQLVDGQHRLMAIAKADIPVPMMVTYNLHSAGPLKIDIGVKRTRFDLLHVPRELTEEASFIDLLNRMLNAAGAQGFTSPSLETISHICDTIKPYSAIINNTANTRIRLWTTAPIRTAAIIALWSGESSAYITTFYNDLVKQNISDLPLVATGLMKYSVYHPDTGGYTVRFGRYIRARYAFTESNRDKRGIIRLGDEGLRLKIANEIKEVCGGLA